VSRASIARIEWVRPASPAIPGSAHRRWLLCRERGPRRLCQIRPLEYPFRRGRRGGFRCLLLPCCCWWGAWRRAFRRPWTLTTFADVRRRSPLGPSFRHLRFESRSLSPSISLPYCHQVADGSLLQGEDQSPRLIFDQRLAVQQEAQLFYARRAGCAGIASPRIASQVNGEVGRQQRQPTEATAMSHDNSAVGISSLKGEEEVNLRTLLRSRKGG
jgi:hypothetical protein